MTAEFTWRCNILKCRTELKDRAVVTTCSHIFCLPCAETQGLAISNNGVRLCPACQTRLVNQDDAVITQLNPSEDYKTSVLSGLSPSFIMECAGRGLAFYSYQVTHEITYQSYLATSLTEKYAGANAQLDSIILQANGQIQHLQDALKESQVKCAEFENKNFELHNAFKQKARAQEDLSKKYQVLKNEKMQSHAMNAASDEAEQVLHTVTGSRFPNRLGPQGGYAGTYQGMAQEYRRPLSASSGSVEGVRGLRAGPGQAWHSQKQSHRGYTSQSAPMFVTPSGHRTRLPVPDSSQRGSGAFTADAIPALQRQPLNSVNPNTLGTSGISGYGMSAGMKMGKHRPLSRTTPRMSRSNVAANFPIR